MKIIALDYDETIALNSYPQAGDPNWPIINKAKTEKAAGAKLILWTCREGEELQVAVEACKEWGLEFDAINDNLPVMKQAWNNNPRKIFANEYWDDRAVNPEDKQAQLELENFLLKVQLRGALELCKKLRKEE